MFSENKKHKYPRYLEIKKFFLNSLYINEKVEAEVTDNLKTKEKKSISSKPYRVQFNWYSDDNTYIYIFSNPIWEEKEKYKENKVKRRETATTQERKDKFYKRKITEQEQLKSLIKQQRKKQKYKILRIR